MPIEFIVEEGGEPRFDVFLARAQSGLSRTAAQRLIEDGQALVNGRRERVSYKLQRGDRIALTLPAPRPSPLIAEEIPLEILYQDEDLAVIYKPAGLVVHPAAGHDGGTLVNALLHHLKDLSKGSGVGGELRPGIVHRIDRQTSGVLLVTKTDHAHRALSAQFKEHTITRRYLGLCWGTLPPSGEFSGNIGRDPKERKRMAILPEGGRHAVTRFRATGNFAGALTAFEAELLTGRTHQVRVHFAAHGFPLAGDATYGEAFPKARAAREAGLKKLRKACPGAAGLIDTLEGDKRQFLHAAHLGFTHPSTGERLEFQRDLPPDLAALMVALNACQP